MPEMSVVPERWPIAGTFTISRGSKTAAEVVVVELSEEGAAGRGECVPYGRYGESPASVIDQIEAARPLIEAGAGRNEIREHMPPGAARNAVDSAMWDLDAKRTGRRVWDLAALEEPPEAVCSFTLSLGTPEEMRSAAEANAHRPVLKLKLGGPGDLERVRAVRAGAPDASIVVDANEAWSVEDYRRLVPALADLGVTMIEQPFPEGEDAILAHLVRPVPVCADESVHGLDSLGGVVDRYDVVNIKLDKTGGLTEALAVREAASEAGLGFMVGCMVGTSLSMAPATLLAAGATLVDLDGPLLLERDREPGLRYDEGRVAPPGPEVWG